MDTKSIRGKWRTTLAQAEERFDIRKGYQVAVDRDEFMAVVAEGFPEYPAALGRLVRRATAATKAPHVLVRGPLMAALVDHFAAQDAMSAAPPAAPPAAPEVKPPADTPAPQESPKPGEPGSARRILRRDEK